MTSIVPVNALDRHISPLAQVLERVATEVISSGYFVLGPNVKAFEDEFAAWCGTSDCVGVANGTEALELGLRSLGAGEGSKVAVVANAAMYGTTAVLACGAQPIFVDIDPKTSLIDIVCLEKAAQKQKIDFVIATHLYGRLINMSALQALAERYRFTILEDCAQSHGARDETGRKAGSFGKAASFSFYPTKNLGALGDGGAVVTSDTFIASKLRRLRQYGWSSKYTNELPGGRNSRLDEMQAAFLRKMLPMLDGWNSRRRAIANRYSQEIKHPRIAVPQVSGDEYVAHLYVVLTDSRKSLQDHLASNSISSEVHYPLPDHQQPLFDGRYSHLELPRTLDNCAKILTLPCFPELSDEEVTRVIEACNKW